MRAFFGFFPHGKRHHASSVFFPFSKHFFDPLTPGHPPPALSSPPLAKVDIGDGSYSGKSLGRDHEIRADTANLGAAMCILAFTFQRKFNEGRALAVPSANNNGYV